MWLPLGSTTSVSYTHLDVYKRQAETYHLCIDSSVLGIEATVDFIEEFVKKKLKL